VLATGGTLSALGAYLFVWIVWRTVDGPRTRPDAELHARSLAGARRRAPLPSHPAGAS
jgi:hypothetical protein